MDPKHTQQLTILAAHVVDLAKRAGADIAEASAQQTEHLSAKVRMGKPELVEEADSRAIGLRIMIGQRKALVHTSDVSEAGLALFVQDAVDLAKLAEPDEFSGPPDATLLTQNTDSAFLELFDPQLNTIDATQALKRATAAEQAAFATDARVDNSEGSSFTRISSNWALVTSGGFTGSTTGTYASIVVNPVVSDSDGKKRSGYYWSGKRHLSDLESDVAVGQEAARRTLAKLGARKIPTQQAPVIFDPDSARAMIGLIASCIDGSAVWRKSSYLADRQNTQVASTLVNIVDDPLRVRAPGSRVFDGEGLASQKSMVIEAGLLKNFLLDTYCARKLGKQSTASASRGSNGGVGPSTSNFILLPGSTNPASILEDTRQGLYVTEMMGFGFNAVTGDFSRGAAGFWIENGKKAFPVSEVTISLNLDQLLQSIDAVGNDLRLDTSVASPTFRVREMTIAGT